MLTQDCLLCGTGSCTDILCPNCAGDLPRLPAPNCPICALPTPNGEVCGRCLAHPPEYDTTRAVFSYDFPLDRLIQSFKYGHRLALGNYFGRQMAALRPADKIDTVVPLPLHPQRIRERGFNQALELARPVSRALHCPIDSASYQRVRHTAVQADLPWLERVKNIRSAFRCAVDLTGKHVLVIDDVMTTGATLGEFARTLKLHGAYRVSLLVLARALPK